MARSDGIAGRGSDRIFGGLIVLIVVWIGTYWLFEPDRSPRVSVATQDLGDELEQVPVLDLTDSIADPEATRIAPVVTSDRVVPPEFREYTVREGDTFEVIARREFGSANEWTAIAQANPLMDPNRLRAGRRILIPKNPGNVQGVAVGEDGEAVPAGQPETPVVEYTVSRGDTLSGIASRFYGSVRYTDFLYAANRTVMRSKNDLRIGQVLVIPPEPADDDNAEP
ncbi:MAG: LysM peptidoglycan-binding domain-containing protein [Planctomycetota bacterium]